MLPRIEQAGRIPAGIWITKNGIAYNKQGLFLERKSDLGPYKRWLSLYNGQRKLKRIAKVTSKCNYDDELAGIIDLS